MISKAIKKVLYPGTTKPYRVLSPRSIVFKDYKWNIYFSTLKVAQIKNCHRLDGPTRYDFVTKSISFELNFEYYFKVYLRELPIARK